MAAFLRCDSAGNHWTPNGPCDESIVALLDQAQVELDPAARKALSDQIELAAMKAYGSFPVYWEQEAVSFWPEVNGYSHFPAPNGSFPEVHASVDGPGGRGVCRQFRSDQRRAGRGLVPTYGAKPVKG